MELNGALPKLARTLFYICAGVLPAMLLAGLSLFFLFGGWSWAVLLPALARLGTTGLIMAAVIPAGRAEARLRLITTTLLLCGLMIVLPMLLATEDFRNLGLEALFAGPALVALHYCWQVVRLSSARERWLLFLVLVMLMAPPLLWFQLRPSPPEAVVYDTAEAGEVTLIVESSTKEGHPVMGLASLSRVPYARIHYQDRTYTPLGAGKVISFPRETETPSSQYVIREQVQPNSASSRWPVKIVWTLHDKEGQLMARRELWQRGTSSWSADTPSGWQGQNAADFFRRVLTPPGRMPVRPELYPEARLRVEPASPIGSVSHADMTQKIVGCDAGITMGEGDAFGDLHSASPDWRFSARMPIDQVFCTGDSAYLIYALSGRHIEIDRLTLEGRFVGQQTINLPDDLSVGTSHFKYVSYFDASPLALSMQVNFMDGLPGVENTVLPESAWKIDLRADQ